MDPFIRFLLIVTCMGVAALGSGPIVSRASAGLTGVPIPLAQGFRFGLGYADWVFFAVIGSVPLFLLLGPLFSIMSFHAGWRAILILEPLFVLAVLQSRMTRAYAHYLGYNQPAARRLALLQHVIFLGFCGMSIGLVLLLDWIVGMG
ncbi:MAG: hypothetical protein IT368_07695 [Candidatus Hydrogenedentes bacterium]|nr:hypothetical protein [Candidatus Hydrogenedentota bacterium]